MDTQNLSIIPDQTQERWLPIPGFTGYDVSDHGRVRSYWRRVGIKGQSRQGFKCIVDSNPQIILKPRLVRGYPTVCLSRTNNSELKKNRLEKIHRLVLITFVGPCPPKHECRHLNGIKENCFLENLKWGTRSENEFDKVKNGTMPCHKGTHNHFCKLTNNQVLKIRFLYAHGHLLTDIGEMFNIGAANVHSIVNRKTWTHI